MKAFLLFISISTFNIFAVECGQYEFNGFVRIINNELVLIANEGTNSEAIISVPRISETKIAPYVNKKVKVNIEIKNKFDGKFGKGEVITRPELTNFNPLAGSKDTYLNILVKNGCAK